MLYADFVGCAIKHISDILRSYFWAILTWTGLAKADKANEFYSLEFRE